MSTHSPSELHIGKIVEAFDYRLWLAQGGDVGIVGMKDVADYRRRAEVIGVSYNVPALRGCMEEGPPIVYPVLYTVQFLGGDRRVSGFFGYALRKPEHPLRF